MAIGTPYTLGTDVTDTTTSTTVSMTTTVKGNSGDRVIVVAEYRAATPLTMSCADNAGTGNTYHLDKQQDGGNGQVGIFSTVLTADLPIGTVVTVTGGSAVRHYLHVEAVSGTAAGNPDANHIGGANSSGTAPSVTTAGSTPATGDYAVAALSRYGSGSSDSATAGGTGSWTEQADVVVGAGTPRMQAYLETQILTTGGAITASPTWSSTTGGWEAAIVVYAAAASGTTYNVTVNATAVSTTATVVRSTGKPVAASAVSTAAGVKRAMSTAIAASAVSTAASVVRQAGLNIAASAVSTAATIVRQAGLNIVASAVGTVANVATMFTAGGGTTYFVTVNATSVGVSAGIVRQALLNIRASVSRGSGATTLGMTNQTLGGVVIQDVEALLGRPFVGLRQNQDISTTGWTTASSDYDLGYVRTYRDIDMNTAGDWAAVVAGTYDTDLTAIATNLMALSSKFNPQNPAIIAISHETSLAYEAGVGTAQEFIDAYRYIRDLWDGMGATVYSKTGVYLGGPIQMAYVGWDRMFTNGAVNSPPAGESYTDFDPDQGSSPAPGGTSYYEYCGSDIYNKVSSPGVLTYGTDAATLFDDVVAQANSRGKPFIIGEMGVGDGATTTDHTNKAAWLASAQAYLEALPRDGAGSCEGIWLTFKNSSDNFMVDSSTQALAAYQAFAQSPVFGTPVRLGPGVVRMGELGVATTVSTAVSLSRALATSISATVSTTASIARRTALSALRATVGTTASVVRKGLLGIAAAVAAVAQATVLRHIPTSPNPERSNQITITQEPNQISVQLTTNVVAVAAEPNQVRISNNGVNIVTVAEAD